MKFIFYNIKKGSTLDLILDSVVECKMIFKILLLDVFRRKFNFNFKQYQLNVKFNNFNS